MIDWGMWLVETAKGTPRKRATISRIEYDFDLWCQHQRIGDGQMETSIKMPWKKILMNIGESWENPDKAKVIDYLETEYDTWIKNRPTVRGTDTVAVDNDFAKTAGKNLHTLLQRSGNAIDLNMLTGLYAAHTDTAPTDDNLRHIREQIRLYANTHSDVFAIQGKGIAKVYRLLNTKNASTGVFVPEPQSLPTSADHKVVQRYTKRVSALGIRSRPEFERALRELHTSTPTLYQLAAWAKEQDAKALEAPRKEADDEQYDEYEHEEAETEDE